jgi:CheY-like chemotaxis protein
VIALPQRLDVFAQLVIDYLRRVCQARNGAVADSAREHLNPWAHAATVSRCGQFLVVQMQYFGPTRFARVSILRPIGLASALPVQKMKPRILLVEDDPAIAEMYGRRLDMEPWDVALARDGAAAVEAAQSAPPDLIVLDIELPVKSGIEVLRELRAHVATKHVAVVVLSNTPGAMSMDVAHRLGISAWAVKSATSPEQLVGLISVYLADVDID